MPTGGQLIVDCLKAQGVDRVFCVPGESYLEALDALYDSGVQVVVARQEGGAAMMAEADGKLTGRPGVAFVTRGPGATNAAAGVHVAKQDSTPMILFVGQIGRRMRGRDAFQEVDYRQTFGDLAKHVEEIEHADRIPEILSRAYHIAMSGRPGPVVLALPEDMLRDHAEVAAGPWVEPPDPAPSASALAATRRLIEQAEQPFLILGGARWSDRAIAASQVFAETNAIPVAVSFRRQGLFPCDHPNYAGDLGLGANPALVARIKESDALIVLGARLSENPSQDFSLLSIPKPGQPMIHVMTGAEELGRIYAAAAPINATPEAFLSAMASCASATDARRHAVEAANAAYRNWSTPAPRPQKNGCVDMAELIDQLRDLAPEAVVTNGAGNYAIWAHRYWRYKDRYAQLAPTSGSMGYGLPAAIAAKLRHPGRDVICFAGDGCFQMTGQEFGAAMQFGAAVIVLVIDNGVYGTIRMHQERRFPGRVSATDLVNPDFAALARAYGGYGETVSDAEQFAGAFERARALGKPSVLHIRVDPEMITPTATISSLRLAAS